MSHREPHRPAFFSASRTKFITSPTPPKLPHYIITFNKHFGQNIRAGYARAVNIGDNNASHGNRVASFNNTPYYSDEDVRITRRVSPLEPNTRHRGMQSDRFGGVEDWLLERSEFRGWGGVVGQAGKAVLFSRESGGERGISKVSGGILRKKRIPLMARKIPISWLSTDCAIGRGMKISSLPAYGATFMLSRNG